MNQTVAVQPTSLQNFACIYFIDGDIYLPETKALKPELIYQW